MRKLTRKQIRQMQESFNERLERQVKDYPEYFEIYQTVLEHLIFELKMIDDGWLYNTESIIEWLDEKKDNLHWFDMVLDNCWI